MSRFLNGMITVPLILSWLPVCPADVGDLDSGFGTGGLVTTDFGFTSDVGRALAIQDDGRILLAGYCSADPWDVALARYLPDGSLDPSFGVGGLVTTDVQSSDDEAAAVAIQPDGRIIVAGSTGYPHQQDFLLIRYHGDGSLDASFGVNGVVTTDLGATLEAVYAIRLQPDGRVVAAGFSRVGLGDANFALARYNADGSLDTGFGNCGTVITSFTNSDDVADAVVIQPDGKIVAAGSTGGPAPDFGLARYRADGTLDATFDDDGKVVTDFTGGADIIYGLTLQPDGRIVAAGFCEQGGERGRDFALARYHADGALDPAFGNGGLAATDFGSTTEFGTGIAVQRDGRIVVAGASDRPGTRYDFTVARYLPDGTLDAEFGAGGWVSTDFLLSGNDVGQAVALQPDGKIVAGGWAYGGPRLHDFALARYLAVSDADGDGIPDDQDDCPESNLESTIVIDGCDTHVVNALFERGCTMSDEIAACAEGAPNHGVFTSRVAHLTNAWKKSGLISGKEKGSIQHCAAQANIP